MTPKYGDNFRVPVAPFQYVQQSVRGLFLFWLWVLFSTDFLSTSTKMLSLHDQLLVIFEWSFESKKVLKSISTVDKNHNTCLIMNTKQSIVLSPEKIL